MDHPRSRVSGCEHTENVPILSQVLVSVERRPEKVGCWCAGDDGYGWVLSGAGRESDDEIQGVSLATLYAILQPNTIATTPIQRAGPGCPGAAQQECALVSCVRGGINGGLDMVRAANRLQTIDESLGEKRLYGVVVLSYGQDTESEKTEDEMFNCLPSGVDIQCLYLVISAEQLDGWGGDRQHDKDVFYQVNI